MHVNDFANETYKMHIYDCSIILIFLYDAN